MSYDRGQGWDKIRPIFEFASIQQIIVEKEQLLDNERIQPTLVVQTTLEEYSTVIALEGELDIVTVDDLHDAVDEALGAGAQHVTIDCRGISFVDSSGLRCLLDTNAKAPRGVALLQPSSSLLRLLEITSLDSMLPVFNNLEAVRAELEG